MLSNPAVAPLRAAQGFRMISVLTDNAALAAAARDAGIDADIAALALPNAEAMLTTWTTLVNANMAEAMASAHNLKVRDRIRMALVTRLEQGDREVTRRALNLLAQPQHAALSAKLLWQAADAMWRAAGDTAPAGQDSRR